ncbi:uncharacterized protein LOC141903891 isoform X2 [Tubulanus polymorphus]|uniref:uncharacterized protein LOC141903891 isoform X2 n=1 Tax=Tubulanus polymorphus TaxID=672921 RepID=UPI003DA39082
MATNTTNYKSTSNNDSDSERLINSTGDSNNEDELEREVNRKANYYYSTFVDLSNMVKAFIGSNYLGIPFGFYQAGILLGCIVLITVIALTAHCCQMIVNCKKYLWRHLVENHEARLGREDPEYRDHLNRSLSYADIGRHALGKAGVVIVDFFLVVTQTGFCVTYFIFIGNTIHSMFPTRPVAVPTANSTNYSLGADGASSSSMRRLLEISADANQTSTTLVPTTTISTPVISTTASASNATTSSLLNTTLTALLSSTTVSPDVNTTVSPTVSTTVSPAANTTAFVGPTMLPTIQISTAPDLIYLVLIPLLPFILFAYIRKIRKMGGVSFLANLAIFGGFLAILSIMLSDFKKHKVELFNWSTFPVFFGQTVSAFEGIGLIIPVETSMDGNQHRFPVFLCIALGIVGSMLSTFGIIGYIRYGTHVQQLILNNLTFGPISVVVDGTLVLAILFTYPLQYFPVAQILERYIFGIGRVVHHQGLQLQEEETSDVETETEDELDDLISDSNERKPLNTNRGSSQLVHHVPNWKRNLLRTVIVLIMCALAVLLRNNFAYISALIGAFGSTALGFILPCIFHLRLEWNDLSVAVKIKDIFIIIIGTVGGVIGVEKVIEEMVKNFRKGL